MSLILDGTNGLSDVDGSAATPAIRGSDANTGVFFGTDIVGVSTGGTERVRVDASGNVGIGTSSPNANFRFTVNGVGTSGNPLGGILLQQGAVTTAWLGSTARDNNTDVEFWNPRNGFMRFATNDTERARIDSSGNLLVNVTTSTGYGSAHRISKAGAQGSFILSVDGGAEYAALFQDVDGGNYNASSAGFWVGRNTSTLRSINAGGTINASGADYAEYMTKAGDFAVAKGGVVGINADGKLTNVFADAVSFCVKSTDPSYVGGDIWGNEDAIGERPTGAATDEEKAAYADALEAARQKVDRIAFAGQVPVNVMGATPGQYIVPADDAGAIKGVAKNESDMTLTDYMQAVGKVIAVESDGRAKIIVKVA